MNRFQHLEGIFSQIRLIAFSRQILIEDVFTYVYSMVVSEYSRSNNETEVLKPTDDTIANIVQTSSDKRSHTVSESWMNFDR